jgi:hypothetical protein
MDIKSAENEIKAEIVANLTAQAEVRINLVENSKRINNNFDVQVRFTGKRFNSPLPNRQKQMVQTVVYEWALLCTWRNLKSHQDCYEHLEDVKTALKGFTPTGWEEFSPLYPVNFDYIGNGEDGEYIWEFKFEIVGEEI